MYKYISETCLIAPYNAGMRRDQFRVQAFDCFANYHEGKNHAVLEQSILNESLPPSSGASFNARNAVKNIVAVQ